MARNQSVLFVATTDSYLKWAQGLRSELAGQFPSTLYMLKSLQNPSPRQTIIAVGEEQASLLEQKHLLQILRWIRRNKPTAVVVAATGPSLVVVRWFLNLSKWGKKVALVSGSPGIAYHLVGRPLRARADADLIILASTKELERFTGALEQLGSKSNLALSTLPFLDGDRPGQKFSGPKTLVFAPQPDMPKSKEDRQSLLLGLHEIATKNQNLKVVVKLRAIENEAQTHFEKYSYPELTTELVAEGHMRPGAIEFAVGSIEEQLLNENAALMTVSSTAALEAIASGNSIHIINDFGISDEIATSVFEGSGVLRPINEFDPDKPSRPGKKWLVENYFHQPELNDWIQALDQLSVSSVPRDNSLVPKSLGLSMFIGELLRLLFPNAFGRGLIKLLKRVAGKEAG